NFQRLTARQRTCDPLQILFYPGTGIADGSCRRCAIAVFPSLADEDQLAIERFDDGNTTRQVSSTWKSLRTWAPHKQSGNLPHSAAIRPPLTLCGEMETA